MKLGDKGRRFAVVILRKAFKRRLQIAVCLALVISAQMCHMTFYYTTSLDSKKKDDQFSTASILTLSEAALWTKDGQKAFQERWVGFPSVANVQCMKALTMRTNNSLYPRTITRISSKTFEVEALRGCTSFTQKFGFLRVVNISKEEEEFPLAFVILFHKDLDQVMYLLRAIYRPHNVYCLAVDLKAGEPFINSVRSIARCLTNVFVASKLVRVVYSGFSRLQADLYCMDDLRQHEVRWKYLLNLPGQEFPLRTNLEMVRIIKDLNGSNNILKAPTAKSIPRRYKIKHHEVYDRSGKLVVEETADRNPPAPHNLKVEKGNAYNIFTRAFVHFVFKNRKAQDFIEWSRGVESPDEYVWTTLQYTKSINVPGGIKMHPQRQLFWSVFTNWEGDEQACATFFVRWICIFSTADLPMLMKQRQLFANKFYIDHHPTALHCLDQYVFNLTVTWAVRDIS